MKRLNKIVRVRLTNEQMAFLQGKDVSKTIREALNKMMTVDCPF